MSMEVLLNISAAEKEGENKATKKGCPGYRNALPVGKALEVCA
ncbi:hypothetical protein RJC98_01750 [Pseudomonas allii]|uniref:Uncharacterized protein n=1 Tax=Pseudomonas allii TaxID=2740531 RepID=A0ACC6L6H3_9PSED|nr:hypothetical protein [Pseudomonas allii]MDR9873890.1 hypothetical protein [Pseudomonas allii]